MKINKILIIQTASIGDVILATPLVEELHTLYPEARIDFLLKKGIEGVFDQHPFINCILIWDKSKKKYQHLASLLAAIRKTKYDLVVNCQRFASSGFITAFSGSKVTSGFTKNPLSFLFSKRYAHHITNGNIHETQRNLGLIKFLNPEPKPVMRLYPTPSDFTHTLGYKNRNYICIAPASLWFTKQYPDYKWVDFVKAIPNDLVVYFLGSKSDSALCNRIIAESQSVNCINLSGKLSFLESAALMRDAQMNYVNDSAPLHIASSVNAPVCAVFCSTVTTFGFGPLSSHAKVVETSLNLDCRPCGLHGYKSCPKKHFACATSIQTQQLLNSLT